MERHASDHERQRPDDQQEQVAERDASGGYFAGYAGEPTRADYGRYGAPGGYDYERGRPTPTHGSPEGATDADSGSPDLTSEVQSDAAAGEERAGS
jgi:hypothetical protein